MIEPRPNRVWRAEVTFEPPNERLSMTTETHDRAIYERWRGLAKIADGYTRAQSPRSTKFFEGTIVWEERP